MRRFTAAVVLLAAAAALAGAQVPRANTLYRQRAEREITALNAEWARAARSADARALGRLLADDFTLTTADGETLDKKEYLAGLASGAHKITALSPEGHQARVHGDAAVLNHGGTLAAEYRGHDTSGRYRWSHFYVRRGRRWVCVATQVTRVTDAATRPRAPARQ